MRTLILGENYYKQLRISLDFITEMTLSQTYTKRHKISHNRNY